MNGFVVIPVLIAFVFLIIGGVIVAVLVVMRHRAVKRVAAIEGAAKYDVAALPLGYGKASGRVLALEPQLVSPLSRTDCVYFHFKVEEQHTRTVTSPGPHGRGTTTRTETYWVTVITDKQAINCAVEDKTGAAWLDILDAETVLESSGHLHSGLFTNAPKHLERTLQRNYGYSPKGWFFNKSLRYTEVVLSDGDKVFVIGEVEFTRAGKPKFVQGPDPFIVSDRSETRLVGHYKTRALWCTVGAVAVAVLTLGIMAIPIAIAGGAVFVNKEFDDTQQRIEAARRQQDEEQKAFAAANDPLRPGVFNPNVPQQPRQPHQPVIGQVQPVQPFTPPPIPPQLVVRQLKPWQVQADPATYAPRGLDTFDAPKAARGIPLGGGFTKVVFPDAPSPFVVVTPAAARGQAVPNGALQVYDLRTQRPTGPAFLAPTAMGENPIVSADGVHVAVRDETAAQPTINVWTATTGRGLRQIVADADPKVFVHPVEFLGKDKLLTMKYHGRFPDHGERTTYQVWNLTTGKADVEFEVDNVFNRAWSAISPGGRYMVIEQTDTVQGYRLLAWDLTTGKPVGEIEFQNKKDKWAQPLALVFSPDGKELALVWRYAEKPDNWAHILVFDAATGKKIADHKLGFLMPSADSLMSETGNKCLRWFPDGSGWLLYGHVLIDRKTGTVLGKMGGKEPTWHAEMPPRQFLDRSHVTGLFQAGLDKALIVERVPVKK